MHRAYKYRVYPDAEQEVLLRKTFGCVRVIWNTNVATFNTYDKINNPKPTFKTTTEIKGNHEWMSEVSAAALQQKEIDFKRYKSQFFNKSRSKKIGSCSFKNKFEGQSYRLPNQKFDLGNHEIRLEKIGWVKTVMERRPNKDCKYLSVTVSRDRTGKYFVSVLVDEIVQDKAPLTLRVVGIDLGLKDFVVTSDGTKISNPQWFRKNHAPLRKAQKHLSKKKKGSNRYQKCKLKVARIHSRIANQRLWFLHQVSLDLVRGYDLIGLEDLDVKGMVKNREHSKSISDSGWTKFVSFLEYKAKRSDKKVVKIDRFFPSTKMCFDCRSLNHALTLRDRSRMCGVCGAEHDRDLNAARNILREAQAQGVACA